MENMGIYGTSYTAVWLLIYPLRWKYVKEISKTNDEEMRFPACYVALNGGRIKY
jgi:hypothetical protein